MSGEVGSYILKLERSVGTFDIGGLRSSPKLQCETWREVVCHICRFSRLRRTLRGLPLVSCRPFLGKGSGSLRSSRIPHGRWDLVFLRCMNPARLVGQVLRDLGLCRYRVDMGREGVWQIHIWVRGHFFKTLQILGMSWLLNGQDSICRIPGGSCLKSGSGTLKSTTRRSSDLTLVILGSQYD